MSRLSAADRIEIRPTNNVYTVLVIVAFVVQVIAFVVLWMRSTALFDKGLFS